MALSVVGVSGLYYSKLPLTTLSVSKFSTLILLDSIFLGLGGYVFFFILSSEVSFEFYLERLAAIVELSGFSEFIP